MQTHRTIWIPPAAMAKELGVSAQTLRRNKHSYVEGKDYINVSPNGDRPTYRWHKQRMLKKFGIKP